MKSVERTISKPFLAFGIALSLGIIGVRFWRKYMAIAHRARFPDFAKIPRPQRVFWTFLADLTDRVRPLTERDLPGALEIVKDAIVRLYDIDVPYLERTNFRETFRGRVESFAYTRATVRMLIVGFEAQLTGERKVPPEAASRIELRDPFTGQPFAWDPLDKCTAIISLGENGEKDCFVKGTMLDKRTGDDGHYFVCFEP